MVNIQSKDTQLSEKDLAPLGHALAAGSIGALFPIGAWLLDLLFHSKPFAFVELVNIHILNPIHYFIDTAPLVLSLVAFYYSKLYQLNLKRFHTLITDRELSIQKNVELAKKIGSNEFVQAALAVSSQDELGQSLLIMHRNIETNKQKEYDQNWIAKGKELISDVLRKFSDLNDLAYNTLVELTNYASTIQGSFYLYDDSLSGLVNIATFAYNRRKYPKQTINIGDGLIGQAAFEMEVIYRTEIPEDYVTISSGILGHKKPSSLVIIPLISDAKLQGIIELASINDEISLLTRTFLKELAPIIAQTIFNLKANQQTTRLLNESREMTIELRKREEILQNNAHEMRKTQAQLELSNKNLAAQIEEVERGRKRLYSLLENASEVISIYDESGVVKYESPSALSILGYEPERFINTNAFQQEHSILHYITYEKFQQLIIAPDQIQTFEFSYRKQTGEQLWLEANARNLINNLAIGGIIINTRDITVRKIAEQAQRMSGEMQALSENSVDVILRLGLDGTFYYANPALAQYTGVDKDDVIKGKLDDVALPAKFIEMLKAHMQSVIESVKKVESEFEMSGVNGRRIMQVNAIPEVTDGILETVLFVAHDITEQKAIELEISEKNKAIGDSINYAQRIQGAIIPDTKIMTEHFPESFIFYRAKDVVSGDFPWMFVKNKDVIYIAAVDCTGHGVPGALLSFVGYFLLNNIVDHDADYTAAEVLDLLHDGVRKTLRQDKVGANARDGMDIALCKIDKNNRILHYSGAHRPLYHLRDGDLKEYRGNKKAIGGIPARPDRAENDFQNYEIKYEPKDRFYIFSDGLPDQVGGEKNRKYQALRMREKIIETKSLPISKVSKFFVKDFYDWMGANKQIDDVLLIGVELE
jgi:PAS domain S-box-containing protein